MGAWINPWLRWMFINILSSLYISLFIYFFSFMFSNFHPLRLFNSTKHTRNSQREFISLVYLMKCINIPMWNSKRKFRNFQLSYTFFCCRLCGLRTSQFYWMICARYEWVWCQSEVVVLHRKKKHATHIPGIHTDEQSACGYVCDTEYESMLFPLALFLRYDKCSPLHATVQITNRNAKANTHTLIYMHIHTKAQMHTLTRCTMDKGFPYILVFHSVFSFIFIDDFRQCALSVFRSLNDVIPTYI